MRTIFYKQMQIGRAKRDILHSLEYRLLAAWITPLPWLERQALELTRVPPGKIVLIPHGIELERFRKNEASRAAARAGLGLPETAFTAGVIGRLDRGKGQEFLLRAAAELKDEGRDLRVLIVGEETRNERQNYGALLRESTARLGISDIVGFYPFRGDIEKVFHALDVFVLTSLSETYGLVTIEAMASGLPVIGTDAAGTPEILRDGETGLLVKPGDPAELAVALRRVMDNPAELRRLGEQALVDAERRFSHLKQCEELERLILRIARS